MTLIIRLIALIVPRADREWILGDIEEERSAIADARGAAAARRWIIGEALRIVRHESGVRLAALTRTSEGDGLMRNLISDAIYAVRLLRRSPAFALTAMLTLAAGVGANAAIFSAVHGVLVAPLPYPEPDRLVRIYEEAEKSRSWPMSPADFRDYRAELQSFEGIAAYMRNDLQLAEGDRPEQLRGMQVTAGFFNVLGIRPAIGREFLQSEEGEQTNAVVVLSDAIWRRRFNADLGMLNRPIRLSGRQFRVVGVLPPGFQHIGGTFRSYGHGQTVDVWWPLPVPREERPMHRFSHYFNVVGRLRPGVAIGHANGELAAAGMRVAARYPGGNSPWTSRAAPLKQEIIGAAEATLVALLGAAVLVLLLACVNVASLLLGRAAARSREMGVRAALGATRLRLAGQLLVESLVLACSGGAIGLAGAYGAVAALVRFGPADTPRLQMVTVDVTVLAYTVTAVFVTALLFGLAPAIQLARGGFTATLKEGGRTIAGSSDRRLRAGLAVVEIALAFVLVASAALLLRSFVRLLDTDPGFRADHAVTAVVTLPPARYDTPAAATFYTRLLDRVRALPGVTSAAFVSDLPWTGYDENTSLDIVGRRFAPGEGPSARYHFVTTGFTPALGIPLVAGRDLAPADNAAAPPVVLINEALAREYWKRPDDAVGARLDLWGAQRTVVGVVGSVKDMPWHDRSAGALYYPQAQQWYSQDMFLVVRSATDPSSLVEPIRRVLGELDPELPLARVRPLDRVAGDAVATRRLSMWLVGAFGLVALFLAVVGVYGVMAEGVAQRSHEFGVRQALGARPADILRLVMRAGATITVVGATGGSIMAFVATRSLAASLYGVTPTDSTTFAGVAALLVALALAASYVPARRAMKQDPAVMLRN
jgi:putative ABC transport system permease protein